MDHRYTENMTEFEDGVHKDSAKIFSSLCSFFNKYERNQFEIRNIALYFLQSLNLSNPQNTGNKYIFPMTLCQY
jgi:hypothetical protein